MNALLLHTGYIVVCLIALALVYRLPVLDLRSLRGSPADQEDTSRADMLERPDLGAVLGFLIIGGVMLAMLVGWRRWSGSSASGWSRCDFCEFW